MKKIILFTLLLIVSATSFSQPITETATIKIDYLKKSKNQNTAAWLMVVGSGALMITGTIVWVNREVETDPFRTLSDAKTTTSGELIAIAGVVVAAGSIPLFIAAAKNKRKAMSLSFKRETIPQLRNGSFVNHSVPSLTLKINL